MDNQAAAGTIVEGDLTAVAMDDGPGDSEAEAGATGRRERDGSRRENGWNTCSRAAAGMPGPRRSATGRHAKRSRSGARYCTGWPASAR